MSTTPTEIDVSPLENQQRGAATEQSALRGMRMAMVLELASRVKLQADGSRKIVRFSTVEIVEHWLLMATFLALGLTGLLQRYAGVALVGWSINSLFGGIDSLRTVHHLAAALFLLVAIYHGGRIVVMWVRKHQGGAMLPGLQDARDLVNVFRYNLGLTKERPRSDRFSVEEKVEYWALVWGTAIMALTGLMQWFPTLTTRFLPGEAIPIARLAHSMEAVLALLSIAIWHIYHTALKEKNRSIFTGLMSENDMRENHPLEYERIIAAYDYVQQLSGKPAAPVGSPE